MFIYNFTTTSTIIRDSMTRIFFSFQPISSCSRMSRWIYVLYSFLANVHCLNAKRFCASWVSDASVDRRCIFPGFASILWWLVCILLGDKNMLSAFIELDKWHLHKILPVFISSVRPWPETCPSYTLQTANWWSWLWSV